MVAFFFPPGLIGQRSTAKEAGYVEQVTVGSATSTPSTTINIGTAASARRVVPVVHWREGGTHQTLTSATIGGVAATIHVQRGHTGGVTGLGVAIISALVPTGTTATLALTFSGGVTVAYAGIWRLVNYGTIVATGSDEAQGSTAALSVSLSTVNDGFVVAGYTGSTNTGSTPVNWTNVTERYDVDGGVRISAGDASVSSGSLTVGASQGVIASSGNDLVVVSFGA